MQQKRLKFLRLRSALPHTYTEQIGVNGVHVPLLHTLRDILNTNHSSENIFLVLLFINILYESTKDAKEIIFFKE